MRYIDDVSIEHKRVILRVDFNVTLKPNFSIANDARIKQALPTIKFLLKNHNTLLLITHLGRPKNHDPQFSLKRVAYDLQTLLPSKRVVLLPKITDAKEQFSNTFSSNTIYMLENIRFFPEEQTNDKAFAKSLAQLADVFVNDAFSVCHRPDASVVGIPAFLPSFGGLLLKKEVETISHALSHPEHPFVAILGGSKVSTKIKLITKLLSIADSLLIGGGMANIFLAAKGNTIGKSLSDKEELTHAKELLTLAKTKKTEIVLPTDAIVGSELQTKTAETKMLNEISENDMILDIGPQTQQTFQKIITNAKTIIWNGPVGYMENELFAKGTSSIYDAIITNTKATSIVGGGETLAAIAKKPHLDRITHISTGGGAMLEYIGNGNLPGIEALERNQTKQT